MVEGVHFFIGIVFIQGLPNEIIMLFMDYDVVHRLEKIESQKEKDSLGDFKRLL